MNRRPITSEDRRRAVEHALRHQPRVFRITEGQRKAIINQTAAHPIRLSPTRGALRSLRHRLAGHVVSSATSRAGVQWWCETCRRRGRGGYWWA